MKNRVCLFIEHLTYMIFNKKNMLIIAWCISSIMGIIYCNMFASLVFDILVFLMFSILIKNYGTILLGIHKKAGLKITMRGIPLKRLKKYSDAEINSLFLNDFKCLLSCHKIHRNIIVDTHGLYAQGVINLLYDIFSPKEKPVKLKCATKNGGCYCNGIKIFIKEKPKCSNVMASMKISLIAKQEIIDAFYKKKYTYYEIIIPKELII